MFRILRQQQHRVHGQIVAEQLERGRAFGGLLRPYLHRTVRRRANHAVQRERALVHERRVALELFEHFARLEAVHANAVVERGRQHLAVVAAELQRRHALRVGFVEAPQALAGHQAPHLDLAILRAGGQHFAVPREGHRQHGLLHHHEIVGGLVLEILADFAGREVPHFDEAINAACE